MAQNVPGVLISSTFYDLKQIRADLAEFIEFQLGYQALISEAPSFPIDPDADTVENCRRRVGENADILVLVIGGRYGSVDKATARSVTNIEYLTARAKGIPIYVFVEKRTLTLLEVWEKAGNTAVEKLVDDPRIFEFVNQVRSVDKVWLNPFETAQDIARALRLQFAHLMTSGLLTKRRLDGSGLASKLGELSGKAFRLALEKPKAWEQLLFAQVLADEVARSEALRHEHRLGIALGSGERVSLESIGGWIQLKAAELSRIVSALTDLVNAHLSAALGPPGLPGDAVAIIFVAQRVAAVYSAAIEWAQHVRRTQAPDECGALLYELARLPESMIEEIERFGPNCVSQIENALATSTGGAPIQLMVEMQLKFPNADSFQEEVDRLVTEIKRRRGEG
jgi:Domain of unknown function (DUF4062)